LAGRLETPIAVGAEFDSLEEFQRFVGAGAVGVLRPDVLRLGGLTTTLKVVALAEANHLPVAPCQLPEIGVQLGCALPAVRTVEFSSELSELWAQPIRLTAGGLAPPDRPGLGLESDPATVERYTART
jgi:mandelate racemase